MEHYQLIARDSIFLYFDCGGNLVQVMVSHSPSFISDNFPNLPFVFNEKEAQELLDLKNECELNSLESTLGQAE